MTNAWRLVGIPIITGVLLQAYMHTLPQHDQPDDQPVQQVAQELKLIDTVEARGLMEATVGSYQDLLAGYAKFSELKPVMSPSATLRFALPNGTTEIYVQRPNGELLRIPLDANGGFSVPLKGIDEQEARGEKWPILVRSLKASAVLPVIHSPRSSETVKSIGDLRLYCETLWAMQRGNASGAQKVALRMMGGMCKSKRIAFVFPTQRKLVSAQIEGAARSATVKISYDALGFSVPLADQSLSNDAVVRLRFED